MPETVAYRPFHNADLPELEQMVLALYQDDVGGEGMSGEKVRRTVGELARHPEKGRILIFDAGAEVVGYAIIIYYWSNEYGGTLVSIDELYVKPGWQGRGIGAAFLQHLIAEEMDAKGLQLEVTPQNARAYAFYLREGFRPAKNRHLFKRLSK